MKEGREAQDQREKEWKGTGMFQARGGDGQVCKKGRRDGGGVAESPEIMAVRGMACSSFHLLAFRRRCAGRRSHWVRQGSG